VSGGARAALFCGAFATAVVLGAGLRISSAHASGGPQPPGLTAGLADYVNSEVDAAMAQADAAFSEATRGELPVSPAESTAGVQAQPPPAPDTSQSSMSTAVPVAAVEPVPIVVFAASPQTTPPPPPPGAAVVPPGLAELVRHDLERAAAGPKRGSHTSRSIVSRKGYLRVELHTSATATSETSSSSATSIARSTVHSTVKSSASGSGSQRNAPPKAPLPFPPFPPNAPAPPNTGASSAGGGGGQGALLIFSVVLAALVFLGIHHLLRKVHWSDLRMPGRGGALPWKPG
jgi:hypothetical protein